MKLAKLDWFSCNFKPTTELLPLYHIQPNKRPFSKDLSSYGGNPSRGFWRTKEHVQLFSGNMGSYFHGTMASYFLGTKGTFWQEYFGNMTNYFQGTWTPWEGLMHPRIPRLTKNFSSRVLGAQDPRVSQDGAHGEYIWIHFRIRSLQGI